MSAVEILTVLATMIGGLALFLFGMNTMSDSLSSMTGGALDKVLHTVTKNRGTAFLFGTGLTAIVQSSSAVSVLTVGLVNSGIIKLKQAIGLLIGGGLGSTMTAWILSLNALDGESVLMTVTKPSFFAPFLAIIGVVITIFIKKEAIRKVGMALLGFAVMMIGMNLMSQGVAPLKELPELQSALMSFTNPIIGFLVAVGFTMLIQSSDATIGIVQAFALSVGVTFGMAIPLICGAQVGTCITALISSLGASNNGKRTALMNLYYSLLKVIPFMLLFYGADALLHFDFLNDSVRVIGIPFFHTAINLFGALIWLPAGGLIVKLAGKTIPFSEQEKRARENTLTMLDENLLKNTSIALSQTDRAVITLGQTVGETMRSLTEFIPEKEEENRIMLERIKSYQDQIGAYITKLATHTTNTKDTAFLMLLTNANTAFGEIGSICGVIIDYVKKLIEAGGKQLIKEPNKTEVRVLGNTIFEILELTIEGYESKNERLSEMVQLYREELMGMSGILKTRHIVRTHEAGGRKNASTTFADICYTEERLVDYCDIIADSLINYSRAAGTKTELTPEGLGSMKKQVRNLFMDKYEEIHIGVDEEGRLIDLDGGMIEN